MDHVIERGDGQFLNPQEFWGTRETARVFPNLSADLLSKTAFAQTAKFLQNRVRPGCQET
jgi:hypothetical protein